MYKSQASACHRHDPPTQPGAPPQGAQSKNPKASLRYARRYAHCFSSCVQFPACARLRVQRDERGDAEQWDNEGCTQLRTLPLLLSKPVRVPKGREELWWGTRG